MIATLPPLRLSRGDTLYLEGQRAGSLYLVTSGVLRLSVSTVSKRQRLADLAGTGDVIGIGALDSGLHVDTAVAADCATVAPIEMPATLASRQGRTELAAGLNRQLVRSRELADDLGLPMGARICRMLARLAQRLGEAPGGGGMADWRHLPFSLTHDDVALMAGCARVTATRILGELREAGVLDGSRGDYVLVPSALEQAADRYVYDVL